MDIYPTLVDLIWNKKPTQPKDGISLLPILTGKQTELGGYIGFGTSENHMVIMDDQYKLHRIKEKETIRWELYDLINDIGEKNNIDKLATQGTRYTQFHVTSGVCSPSRTSVITGHFPARYRIHGHFAGNAVNARRGMPNWLDENLPAYLPRLMQEAGYATAHFGKWHLGGGGEPNGDLTAPEPKVYGYDETRVWNGNGPTWKSELPE